MGNTFILVLSVLNCRKMLTTGGLFDISDSASESAFRLALNRVNNDEKLKLAETKLVATSGQLPSNPYFATNKSI